MAIQRIQKIEAYAEKILTGPFVVEAFRIAHDLPHVRRVYANAMRLAQAEGYPHLDRVAAAALLHDIGLPVVDKRGDHPRVGAELAAQFLQGNELFAPDEITEICEAIVHHGRLDGDTPLSTSPPARRSRTATSSRSRPVIGSIRWMTANGCKSKFDTDGYIRRIASL